MTYSHLKDRSDEREGLLREAWGIRPDQPTPEELMIDAQMVTYKNEMDWMRWKKEKWNQ